MQDFMQSLQMRWPVAAHIGLSMVTMAKRADRIAVLLGHVHLGDLLVERAAVQRDAEHGLLELAGLLAHARGAGVFALVVALDAVARLIERAREIRAGVGQLKAFAMAPV